VPLSKWKRILSENKQKAAGIIVCIGGDDRILIVRRSTSDERHGQWTIPGGHIEEDDRSIEQGATRELFEETGLACSTADLTYIGEPKPEKYYFWTVKWSGMVNVSNPNPKTGEIEHDNYKWAEISDIKDIANTEIPIYLLEKALDMSKNVK
jgi:8-oxo-dGTP pyrophosphatase MutT (NUDIX family)